jgi:uncharacterized membrane protein
MQARNQIIDYLKQIGSILAGPKQKLPTLKLRMRYLTNLSLMPCFICFLAFTRSFIYRYIKAPPPFIDEVSMTCSKFGWLNNASIRMTCNNRPLDIHATLAMTWLTLFTLQTLTRKFHFNKIHKYLGIVGQPIAVINCVGMIQLTLFDIISPMKTERPPIFTPFMFLTACIIFVCLYQSWLGLRATPMDVDMHALWIVRAFLMSFTTPIIRFYPIVLRYIFSTACIKDEMSLNTWVIGSMTVAATLTLYLFWLANKACLDDPVDNFLKGFIVFEVGCVFIDIIQTFTKGTFFGHMYRCYKEGRAGPTIFDSWPVHPLLLLLFVAVFCVWVFYLLVQGYDDDDDDADKEKDAKDAAVNEKTGLIA